MRPYLFTGLLVILLPNVVFAGSESATFEAFYRESSAIGWILAAVVALFVGTVIFFTGGTASPIVVGIGSWLGGMMGYSGIVATNAGLALLGGGSIASGGFGVIGGTALLTAALSFSTDIVVDYTISEAVVEYKYNNLIENSERMTTLPLPMNNSGPEEYEVVLKILESVDNDLPFSSNKNKKIISKAVKELEKTKDNYHMEESVKTRSLLSLLYFISNDYKAAEETAFSSISSTRASQSKITLPAFIYATSSLYKEEFDFKLITRDYFRYSILAEPDNPLIPLLFSIYLDRISLRINDGFLAEESLRDVFEVMQAPSLQNKRVMNFTILLSRYFIRLKLEQQKIRYLTSSSNKMIKSSPKTLEVVRDSLTRYDKLISDSNDVMKNLISLEMDAQDRKNARDLMDLLISYKDEKQRLVFLINDLENYQDDLAEEELFTKKESERGNFNFIPYVILLIIVLFLTMFARRQK